MKMRGLILSVLSCAALSALATVWIGDGRPLPTDSKSLYAQEPAPLFRARFVLPAAHRGDLSATVACAGYYIFSVNGRRLSETSLMPLWSPYNKTVYADNLKIPAGALMPHPATNEVQLLLGNGWRNISPLKYWGRICFRDALASGSPCFNVALDGVSSPLEWEWRESGILRNCIFLGTAVDATRDTDGAWRPASVVEGPRGRVVPRRAPPITVRSIVRRPAVSWLKEGKVQVIDLGENVTGFPTFRLRGVPRGTKIEVVYGERLKADGSVNVLTQTAGQIKPGVCAGGEGAPELACARDVYIAAGGSCENFTPLFTWHICRYLEVRGCPRLLAPEDVSFSVISSSLEDAEAAKNFRCADLDLVRLHEICRRTFRNNLIGVQSDCPGRERLGYGGDIVATAEAMMLNWDMREFYLKTLQDFADEASDDGWITETAPYVGISDRAYGGRSGPIGWALAVPVLIDGLIRHYPDVAERALEYYPMCARYVELMAGRFPSCVVPTCIGDHETLDRRDSDSLMATAHWYEFVRLTAAFADRLGKTDDAARFRKLAKRIAEVFAAQFIRDGVVGKGSQGTQATALFLGLVPADQITAAESVLLKELQCTDYSPTTGIFSTRYMLMYLSEHGRIDIAGRIVRNRAKYGWMQMMDRGATTLWETWKESDNIFSNCHPMFGSVDEWILRYAGK